MKTTEVWTLNF